MAESAVMDARGRPLGTLRLSVIDKCNLRCQYCMPEDEYTWLPRTGLLSFEEFTTIAGVFADLGVNKVRLTGGEPLLRQGLADLVSMLKAVPGLADLALTTNGVLLADHARKLHDAGLDRVTVSLDTLRPDRFIALSRRNSHAKVLAGIEAAADVFGVIKLDTVVMRGFNDDELIELIEFGKTIPAEVRFIEYMDVGGATAWSKDKVYSRDDMLRVVGDHYGAVEELGKTDAAPADRFALPDGTMFGIISSTTRPFCATCDRSRVTADGMWYRCLYAHRGTDLRTPLRSGATPAELAELITGIWRGRRDQGAVDRHSERQRSVFIGIESLKRDPHLEMHTRGG